MDSLLTFTLGSMDDSKVIPWLIDISRNENIDVGVRSLSIDVLSKKEGPEVTNYFIDMLVALSGNDYVHETRRQLTGLMTAIYTTQI